MIYSKDDKFFMDFKGENGEKITLEVITELFIDKNKYLILCEDDDYSEDAFVVKENVVDGNIEYIFVEDEEEFLRVRKEYKKIIYD